MKKVLLSLSLFSSISCMNNEPLDTPTSSSDDEVDIIELAPNRWKEFKALDLEARASLEISEITAQDQEEGSPQEYQRLLEDSLLGEDRWVIFAQHRKKLIGMAGAARQENPHVATIHSDYANSRLEDMLGHTDMIESLLWKIAQCGITQAHVQISPTKTNIIRFYEQIGFVASANIDSKVLMVKELKKE